MTSRPVLRRAGGLVLFLLFLAASPAPGPADLDRQIADGERELRDGNSIAAMRAFRAALQRAPDCWQALDGLGRTFRAIGDLDAAERELRRAVTAAAGADPAPARHLADLLGVLPSPERRREGIVWLGEHAAAAFDIQMFVAREARRSGDGIAARAALDRARALQPDSKEAMVEEILLHRDALQYERAEALALAFIERFPAYPQTHIQLGRIYRLQGRLDEAAEHYRIALDLAPDEPTALTRLGEILLERGEAGEARALLIRAVAVNPQGHHAHYLLGRAFLQLGDAAAAAAEMATFRELKDALRARTRLAGGAAMADE